MSISMEITELIDEHTRITNLLRESIITLNNMANNARSHEVIQKINILMRNLHNEYKRQYNELQNYIEKRNVSGGIHYPYDREKYKFVMNEFKNSRLFDKYGWPITNKQQAQAIALNAAGF